MIKNKLKVLLRELKKFRQYECKKRNNRKIFHSSTKFSGNSDIDESFKSMYQKYYDKNEKPMLVKIGFS